MGDEAPMKERRVTRREYTTFMLDSKNSIALQVCPIQPFSLYLDLVKCSLDETTQAALVHTYYKWVGQEVKPVPLSS